jgi:PIN domain nuclease of toxin-antitoxin system
MRRYLADTHTLLWFFAGDVRRLGKRARRILEAVDGINVGVVVSVISLWEVAQLNDTGRVRLPAGYTAWCDHLEELPGLRVEPLLRGDVEMARSLRGFRDPSDRLIAGTALRLKVPLLSGDGRIAASGRISIVWD